jgi:hypothetical protein
MRLARLPAEIVAPTMGHRDTRMVEPVYGRLSPDCIAAVAARDLSSGRPAAAIEGGEDLVDVRIGKTQRANHRGRRLYDRPMLAPRATRSSSSCSNVSNVAASAPRPASRASFEG